MNRHLAITIALATSIATSSALYGARVSNIRMDTTSSRRVEIRYDLLGGDAIVTAEILTNNLPIGVQHFLSVTGCVNCLVREGEGRSIWWDARKDWSGQEIDEAIVSARVTAWPVGAPPDYLVLDLSDWSRRFYSCAEALPLGLADDVYRSSKMVFRRVPAAGAAFLAGAPDDERKAASMGVGWGGEARREVTLSRDFFLGVFEVTQAQAEYICGETGATAGTLPLQGCSRRWLCGTNDAPAFADGADGSSFLASLRRQAGGRWTLPTEAQWEFACRAGCDAAFSNGRGFAADASYGEIAHCVADAPRRVGELAPNAWGFYDMHGNVREWCLDNPIENDVAVDPAGGRPASAVLRGGGWSSEWREARCAARWCGASCDSSDPSFGVRLACAVDGVGDERLRLEVEVEEGWRSEVKGQRSDSGVVSFLRLETSTDEAGGPRSVAAAERNGQPTTVNLNLQPQPSTSALRLGLKTSTSEDEKGLRNVSIEAAADVRGVTVSYDLLGEGAIITACGMTNGVPVASARAFAGEVWRFVETGRCHKAVWRPDLDFGAALDESVSLSVRLSAWSTNAPPDWFVLDLADDVRRRRFYEDVAQLPCGLTSDVYRTTKMVFRRVPAEGATFTMGSSAAERTAAGVTVGDVFGAETQHRVTFTKDFYMGVFEVTQGQWRKVYGSLPEQGYRVKSDAAVHPVENVAWSGQVRLNETLIGKWPAAEAENPQDTHFLGKLRLLAGGRTVPAGTSGRYSVVVGAGYDLPTEAQWEFACRAGCEAAYHNGLEATGPSSVDGLELVAWYSSSADGASHRVGELEPNAWGLYDMHGNVSEWCLDNVESGSKSTQWIASDRTDPKGPVLTASRRAYRGGSFSDVAQRCRSAGVRYANADAAPTVKAVTRGFRVVCPPEGL